jgi:hypothetical protein
MSFLLDKLAKTDTLPMGHIDIRLAEEAVSKEYEKCRKVEDFWGRKFPREWRRLFPLKFALEVSNHICDAFGEKRINGIVQHSSEVHSKAGGHYDYRKKLIHFKWGIGLRTLIHELTHHCRQFGHGDGFCEVENLLFQAVYPYLTGKQVKPDWLIKLYKNPHANASH